MWRRLFSYPLGFPELPKEHNQLRTKHLTHESLGEGGSLSQNVRGEGGVGYLLSVMVMD